MPSPTPVRKKIWVVYVRVDFVHVAFVQRQGFRQTKSRGHFAKAFESREFAELAVEPLKTAGLHGVIKNRWQISKTSLAGGSDPYNPGAVPGYGGFGGRLNSTPTKGNWRLKRRTRQ